TDPINHHYKDRPGCPTRCPGQLSVKADQSDLELSRGGRAYSFEWSGSASSASCRALILAVWRPGGTVIINALRGRSSAIGSPVRGRPSGGILGRWLNLTDA